jgi:hypothetical protein
MKTFRQTSDEPYDRHDYKLVLENGKSLIFDDYEILRHYWMNTDTNQLSHVEVLDKTTKKGFKK